VFSTFGHFSKVKSHVFLTSRRLSRSGSKLDPPPVRLVESCPVGALPGVPKLEIRASGGQKVIGMMQFSCFPGSPKTNWGERKPAQIWPVLAFSGPFFGGSEGERTDADYWGVIDKF